MVSDLLRIRVRHKHTVHFADVVGRLFGYRVSDELAARFAITVIDPECNGSPDALRFGVAFSYRLAERACLENAHDDPVAIALPERHGDALALEYEERNADTEPNVLVQYDADAFGRGDGLCNTLGVNDSIADGDVHWVIKQCGNA